jgi:hypothetical protein
MSIPKLTKLLYEPCLDNKQVAVLSVLTRKNNKIVHDKEYDSFLNKYPNQEINCRTCYSCHKKFQLNYLLYNVNTLKLYKPKDEDLPVTFCKTCLRKKNIVTKKTKACKQCGVMHFRSKSLICKKCESINNLQDKIKILEEKIDEIKKS